MMTMIIMMALLGRGEPLIKDQAWEYLHDGNYEMALSYAGACVESYEQSARFLHREIAQGYANCAEDEKYKCDPSVNEWINKYYPVIMAAECLFVEGQAYENLNLPDRARGAYEQIIEQYPHAMAGFDGSWWWSPPEDAKKRLEDLKD